MTILAIIMMVVAMLVTVGILFAGIIGMARGGEFNQKWGNRLMRYRIVAQFIALVMFGISIMLLRAGGG
ncbi:MAG TPA: twin transmembrane helix small protein [Rhodospirillaceae bacterium]|nr:hypothetical protein [Rhodospirillaceae bacterium]MAX64754.1 hypothetical protein [Rhodospirillaceae bacterium]MBB58727.1 hypothetical protein [Rhodospirillaceae bacterium]HAE00144.1 twin transmembrane helix small protein [Rhodospirillaceae bacterium]HBM11314.1 twin transmembrane helix small protein [Rhodospirillaceae bacterium]